MHVPRPPRQLEDVPHLLRFVIGMSSEAAGFASILRLIRSAALTPFAAVVCMSASFLW